MAIRKNHSALSDQEKKDFVAAVLGLKQQPSMLHPGEGTFSRYDDYVELHVKSMMAMPDGWAHTAPAFFPWHRVLLYQFERDLQQVGGPSIAVPYWDWTDGSTPLTAAFLGGDGDPNKDYEVVDGAFTMDTWTLRIVDGPGMSTVLKRRFGWDLDASNKPIQIKLPDAAAQDRALKIRWYDASPWDRTAPPTDSFRQAAERDLHNLVHRYVGGVWPKAGAFDFGTMMQMSSPNDPVFWLHHCNLDRMWSAWQALHPVSAAYLPRTGAAPGHNLHDHLVFGEPMAWIGMFKASDIADTTLLGYSYDALQQVSAAPAPPMPMAMRAIRHEGRLHHDPRRMFPLKNEP